jgi:hypothetical protein
MLSMLVTTNSSVNRLESAFRNAAMAALLRV